MSNVGVTDTPLSRMEEDLFSVQPYVKGLSSFINTCETPMTISIQGDWGSGKTSMKLCFLSGSGKRALKASRKIAIL